MAIETICGMDEMNKSYPCGEWIPVSERLPITEKQMQDKNYLDRKVIIATKHFVDTDCFQAGNTNSFWCQFKDYKQEVTHWMPLPSIEGLEG